MRSEDLRVGEGLDGIILGGLGYDYRLFALQQIQGLVRWNIDSIVVPWPHHDLWVDISRIKKKQVGAVDSGVGGSWDAPSLEEEGRVDGGCERRSDGNPMAEAKGLKDIVTISLEPPLRDVCQVSKEPR